MATSGEAYRNRAPFLAEYHVEYDSKNTMISGHLTGVRINKRMELLMNCPSCSSGETQRLEVIYEQGTSHSSATSRTRVRPFMGILPMAMAKTKTTGVTMSKAAQKAAPPAKMLYKVPIIGVVVGFVLLGNAFGSRVNSTWLVLGLVAVGAFGWLLVRRIRYNMKEWPGSYAVWEKSWMCNKCGNIFRGEA